MHTVPEASDMPAVTGPPPPIPRGIVHWYGHATGSWWAMIPGRSGPFLVEAVSADALASAVHSYLQRAAW